MKREGILDEIEKLVDEVWDIEKKQINTHVDREKKKMDMWFDNAVERQMRVRHDEYRNEYLRELQRRQMWDSPMSGTYGGNPRRSPSTTRHKCGGCGLNMKVVYIEERIDFQRYMSFSDTDRVLNMEKVEYDHFFCPRCRGQIRVVGKVIEITVEMKVS